MSLLLKKVLHVVILIEILALYAPVSASADNPVKTPPTATQTATTTAPAAASAADSTKGTYQAPPIPYNGVEASISRLLCTPDMSSGNAPDTSGAFDGPSVIGDGPTPTNANARDLAVCINRLYRFGAAIGSFAAIFFVALAGYYYILGGESAKEKAKHMIFSVIAGLVIIFTSFILLRQINPEAVKFKTIQPPALSGVPDTLPSCRDVGLGEDCVLAGGGGQTGKGDGQGGGIPAGSGIINGYNIGAYATASNHETLVASLYTKLQSVDFSTDDSITAYMKKIAPNTPLTGSMVSKAAKDYNVDVKVMVALMQVDSQLGTLGKGARTHNPGNVGNDDTGALKDWGTWDKGVAAVAEWLNKHRAK